MLQLARLQKRTSSRDERGIGDSDMRRVIERQINARGITERVERVGWCDGAEVRSRLLAGRMLVLSSFAEGLPVVVMEAMAIQRPVLVTAIMGIPELVRDGEDGWVVIAGDRAGLADALLRANATPLERLREMGRAGQLRVGKRHSVEAEVRKLDMLFKRLSI